MIWIGNAYSTQPGNETHFRRMVDTREKALEIEHLVELCYKSETFNYEAFMVVDWES